MFFITSSSRPVFSPVWIRRAYRPEKGPARAGRRKTPCRGRLCPGRADFIPDGGVGHDLFSQFQRLPEIVSAGEEHGHDRGEAARGDLTVKAAEDRQAGAQRHEGLPPFGGKREQQHGDKQREQDGDHHQGTAADHDAGGDHPRVGGRLGPEVGEDGGEDGHHRNHQDSDDGRHEKDEDMRG